MTPMGLSLILTAKWVMWSYLLQGEEHRLLALTFASWFLLLAGIMR